MVIAAHDLERKIKKINSQTEKRLEKTIDDSLLKGHYTITLDASTYSIPDVTVQSILKKYRAAGWTISYQYLNDQRDGNYHDFTLNPRRR